MAGKDEMKIGDEIDQDERKSTSSSRPRSQSFSSPLLLMGGVSIGKGFGEMMVVNDGR